MAVLAGGLVGAAPFLWLTIGLAIQYPQRGEARDALSTLGESLWFALMPLIVSSAVVLAASVVIGLPVDWLLKRRGLNAGAAYMGLGAVVGFLIVVVALLLAGFADGYWFAILGAVSGAATARVWWGATRTRSGGVSPS